MVWFYLIVWLLIAGAALYLDATTSSFLFIWFTIGGIAAIIANFMGKSFSFQLIVFVSISVAFMAVGYPLVKKAIKKTVPSTPTMEQSYIGREFIADKDIEEKASIKFDGIYWTVKNSGEYIKKGDKVKVTGIEGNKLVIKKI